MKCDEEPGSDGCPDLLAERIRYFTGRHMTARDFRDADAYHRTHRYLHNRVLHGWGIACGLGRETTALIATGFALVVLALLPHTTEPAPGAGPK